MKNFCTQILSAMMVVMVYAASLREDPRKLLLKQIEFEACKIRHKPSDELIPWPDNDGNACVEDFFCLAERALKHIHFKESNITTMIHKYNNLFEPKIQCHLNMSRKIRRNAFLADVEYCADKAQDLYLG